MKKISAIFIIAFFLGSLSSFGQIIISQIYEGTSYNKFIEITNIGASPVDLASPQLTIKTFNNKADVSLAATYTKNLSGTLAPGQCYLIRHGLTVIPAYAVSYTPGDTNSVANFNGTGTGTPITNTDIITLYNGTTLVDVFAWGTFQYSNQSYYRNLAVTVPNATWTVSEWTSVTNAVVDGAAPSTIERLGYHGASSTTPVLSITSPTEGSTVYSTDVNIIFSTTNFIIGTDGHIHYTIDGGSVNEYTVTTPIALTSLLAGSHKVVMKLVDNSHNPLVPNVADSVNFTVDLTAPTITSIYEIQHTTLPGGSTQIDTTIARTTTGIVTASFSSGYFIQDSITPWNGLYVYDNAHTPALGDSILVTGTVSEYKGNTELKTITYYYVVTSGNTLPVPIPVTTASVKAEQYEGMLVKITNATCTVVDPSGWWKVFQGSDTCEIGKLMYPFPTAVVGTAYNITGLCEYYYGFQVDPRNAADIEVYAGITENELNLISIYPNPVTSDLNIANIEGIQQIRISNMLGEIIQTYLVSGNSSNINVGKLQSGIYFVTFIKDDAVAGTRKFIKL